MTIYNFSAGPATLPKPVLEKAQAELLNYQDSGMSVLEMSHRSPEFDKIVKDAEATLRELMAIPDNYKVIFLQGGASTQFTMVPLNLAQGKKAYYLVGGSWGKKAYTEAVKLSKTIPFEPILLASSEETVYDHIPSFDPSTIDPEAAYVHLTTNNTIEGTSIYDLPDTNGVPIVADMSSNILAARYNVEDFALIYAGAQKNIGPAGVTVVIVREDFLNDQPQLSAMLDYRIQAEGLKSAGDIVYHLMTGLLHLFGSRDIFLNAVKSQIPETFQESGYTIDSSVIPFCIQFRRSYEQLIHT